LDHAKQASFFGMIANIDENMGKLEQMLISEGLRDNIVIFMTDNGTANGDVIVNAGCGARSNRSTRADTAFRSSRPS
jgi:arylsulfatase A-like enzyme